MPDEQAGNREDRVLVLAPTARDAAMSRDLLTAAGLSCQLCNTIQDVCAEMSRGAAAAVVTAEALLADRTACMVEALRAQPPWSDFPLVVLTAPGSDLPKNIAILEAIGHMTFMKRPVQVAALVSTVRAAVRDRRRQYVVRDHLLEQRRQAERKDEFLAMLAHELRNPLAPIRNSLQVMRLTGADREMFEDSRAMMERQVGHMVRIIDDLLDVSRVSRGTVELRRGRVDLATVIQAAIETSRPALDAPDHQLTISLPDSPLFVDGDATRLTQVFANLLNNAAKYSEPRGHITLTARREGPLAVISVRDTGIGIPAEMLPKVFDLFTQVDRRLDRSQGGLGIGLTLAKTLVELHGGTIEVASGGRGQGSEFTVRLPVLPGGTADETSSLAAGATRSPPKAIRILVVDDNEDAATSLATLLRMFGHEVDTAYDGPAALRRVETQRPAVVFLDLGMPGMSGFEVARQLRQRRELAPVRLVALSGWGADIDRRRSQETGFDHHFVKPVEPTDLLNYLDQIGVAAGAD